MTDSWYLIVVIVAIALLVVLYLRGRQRQQQSGDRSTGLDAGRDFGAEREDTRLTGMSAEDREWETASQRRNQDNRDQADKLAGTPPALDAEVRDRGPGV